MKIIPERVTILPDLMSGELTVIMEGYRLTLNPEEARALSYALLQATKHVPLEAPRPPSNAHTVAATAPTFSAKSVTVSASPDGARAASDEAAQDVIRSLSA